MAEEENTEKAPSKDRQNKNPLLAVLLIVNAIGMGAVAFFQYQAHQREMKRISIEDVIKKDMAGADLSGEGGEEIKEKLGLLLPLNPFTANLAQGDGPRRYVRMNAVLKFSDDSKEAEFAARKPQIRDSIISILNTKRPNDLLKVEGKSYLKEEIKTTINSFLVDGKVIDVFYVSFQIN